MISGSGNFAGGVLVSSAGARIVTGVAPACLPGEKNGAGEAPVSLAGAGNVAGAAPVSFRGARIVAGDAPACFYGTGIVTGIGRWVWDEPKCHRGCPGLFSGSAADHRGSPGRFSGSPNEVTGVESGTDWSGATDRRALPFGSAFEL